jgi:hypothetical protein
MANTYTLIASNTVGSGGVASVTFSSIPATYTDLVIKASIRTTRNVGDASSISITLNGSTSSRTSRIMYGNGSTTTSYSDTILEGGYANQNYANPANTYSSHDYYFPNYASSNFKSMHFDSVNENNASNAYALLTAALWSNTAAITSITLECPTFSLVQYSSFYLYGIKNS